MIRNKYNTGPMCSKELFGGPGRLAAAGELH